MSTKTSDKLERALSSPLFEKPELLLLAFARKTLTPERWTRGSVRRAAGEAPSDLDNESDYICIQGALEEVMHTNGFSWESKVKAEQLLRAACAHLGYQAYQSFNDYFNRQYEEVRELLTVAIALGMDEKLCKELLGPVEEQRTRSERNARIKKLWREALQPA